MLASVRPDAVLITAGQASVAAAWKDPAGTYSSNTAGPFHLLDAARRIDPSLHVIFSSSASVYGPPASPESMPFTEEAGIAAASPYGASKAAAEVLCGQFARQYGLDLTTVRIFNQIGPAQSDVQAPAEFSRKIATAERKGEGRLLLPVGNVKVERDFSDVRDTVRAFRRLIETRTTGVFNVCSGLGTSLGEIIEGLSAHTGVEIEIETNPEFSHRVDIPSVYGSHDRLTAAIGWHPEIELDQSLADLLDDWRART